LFTNVAPNQFSAIIHAENNCNTPTLRFFIHHHFINDTLPVIKNRSKKNKIFLAGLYQLLDFKKKQETQTI
jgi:hypothetical protein